MEYDFVRLRRPFFSVHAEPTTAEGRSYHEIIVERASQGWRLVQLFAPSRSGFGRSDWYENIFERNSSRSSTDGRDQLKWAPL